LARLAKRLRIRLPLLRLATMRCRWQMEEVVVVVAMLETKNKRPHHYKQTMSGNAWAFARDKGH
jgi:hypothetical protein